MMSDILSGILGWAGVAGFAYWTYTLFRKQK